MEYLKIIGGKDISGSVEISGAKNAALPLIACTILGKNEITIGNLPNVVDIKIKKTPNTFLKKTTSTELIESLNSLAAAPIKANNKDANSMYFMPLLT